MGSQKRCVGCGRIYELTGASFFVCPNCGEKQSACITPGIYDILINAANFRRNGDFIKANSEYREVIKSSPDVAESYWGAFLSEYRISDEKSPIAATNATPVFQNRYFQKARDLSGNFSEWTDYATRLEAARQENVKFAGLVAQNDYHAVLIRGSSKTDLQRAYEIYSYLKNRVNVLYPQFSLKKNCSPDDKAAKATALRYSMVACEKIRIGIVICSEEDGREEMSSESTELSLLCRAFLSSPELCYLYVVSEGYTPPEIECNKSQLIIPDENANETILTKIRLVGDFSLEEMSELRNTGKLQKIQNNPSPEITLKGEYV